MHKRSSNIIFFLGLIILLGCKTSQVYKASSGPSPVFMGENLDNWAAHPWKEDPSDRVPKPLQDESRDSIADVFFIYPTSYLKEQEDGLNARLDNERVNKKTETAILNQASVFNQHCRVFAPRYRQAHYSIFFDFDSKASADALDTAYSDIREAFVYYMAHLHKNQPLIIAAHSQGTIHAARLIKEFLDGKEDGKYFVCAYLLGMPVPADYFK